MHKFEVNKLTRKMLLTLALLVVGNLSFATEPIVWPLKINISQSSSFAEFRGFRFHAGIDLRTKRATGFPVLAIEDGYISRIKVQYRGYGYALYIDHPKLKKRVVYGHLQDFADEPGKYVKKKLASLGQRFGIDDFFGSDKFPVKKGQVVAWSGESGSGPPHLHFELRTMADEPVAPALIGFRPKDKIYPSFHKFYLEPLSYPCEINGSFLPYVGTIKKQKAKKYFLPAEISMSGNTGVQIGISDTNGVGNIFGVESVVLSKNDEVQFSREFHKYSYGQNAQCYLVYDYYKSNLKGTGFVVNLFKLPRETLPFALDQEVWSGVFKEDEQKTSSNLKIVAKDFGSNEIELRGKLISQKVDYSQNISLERVEKFIFNDVVTTPFYIVATGRHSTNKKYSFERGKVACKDGDGNIDWLPCIVSGKAIEVAFPIVERWQKGAWLGEKRILPETQMVKTTGRKVFAEEGGMVEFGNNDLLFPVFSRFYRVNLAPAAGGNKKNGLLKPFSAIWKLDPKGVVFSSAAKIKIRPGKYEGNFQKLGIYKVLQNGKYSHVGENVLNNWLVADTRLGGSWIILEDLIPPVVSYQKKGKDYHLGRVWVFKVRDLGEGVNYLSARAICGKRKLEVYSDPDKSELYVVRGNAKGKLKIELSVEDYAGNKATLVKSVN